MSPPQLRHAGQLARYQREKEEARRKEEERLRREAEELRRKMEDQHRKRREMEADAAKRKLEEEALAEAVAREAEGDHETATLILNHAVEQVETFPEPVTSAPMVLVAPVAQAMAPKVRGVGFREVPKWRMKCGHDKADDPSAEFRLPETLRLFNRRAANPIMTKTPHENCLARTGMPSIR